MQYIILCIVDTMHILYIKVLYRLQNSTIFDAKTIKSASSEFSLGISANFPANLFKTSHQKSSVMLSRYP